jgi:hypothetical protein
MKTKLKMILLTAAAAIEANAQSQERDIGHCVASNAEAFACWNPEAGRLIPTLLANIPEFLPNLNGWDFRINLPHVQFQFIRNGLGSPMAMAGVIEDPSPLYRTDRPFEFADYGHRNNSIWLFRVDAADGQLYFSLLPSRFDRAANRTENVTTLTGAWFRAGSAPGRGFRLERLGVAVAGKGIGTARVHVVAWGQDGRLYHSQRLVDQANITQWTTPWQDLGEISATAPSLVTAAADELALGWVDPTGNVKVKVFNTVTGTWSTAVLAGQQADLYRPRLVWDGTALNMVFSGGDRLRHSYRTASNPMTFSQPTIVSSFLPVFQGQFDAIAFNRSLHIVVRTNLGDPPGARAFYIATRSWPGDPAQWTIPSDTGLAANSEPRIATLYENLFVIARTTSGEVCYSRKDPNRVDNRITGGALADRWLDVGTQLDAPTTGSFSAIDTLTFNSDLYLVASRSTSTTRSSMIINFGRAAMKHLLTSKWQMTLMHGEKASNGVSFGGRDEIRMAGDFNGDRKTDVIRFPQRAETGVGPAPVHVRLVRQPMPGGPVMFGEDAVWHKFFSLKGEIPLVGNFDGDPQGKDDIVTFTQQEQRYSDGTPIGPAVVWVALSNGSQFGGSQIWHRFFSLKGEIPLVGDFNGDGKDDVITFVQKEQKYTDGTSIGPAPVWVSLSDGTRFGTSRIWHTYFSLQGETPMIGDFNGDGKDDIATFVGKEQYYADGTLLGHAPVWVSLSDGTRFGPSRVWHTFFSLRGEFPMVADVNMDGRDDIVTFLRGRGPGLQANNVYVAFSNGSNFERSVTWASNQAASNETPFVANFTGRSLADITLDQVDQRGPFPDLYVFDNQGTVRLATAMRMIPYPVGAPWERYRFFTEKGNGTASFPEWIYATGPNHCLSHPFQFGLIGAAGVGGANFMLSSVRPGGGQGHIMEEQGHSMFANCLRADKDPFGKFALIYQTPMSAGGLEANNMPGCDPTFDDCRDPEHFFLGLLKHYRLNGDEFRNRILNGPADVRNRRRAQYLWLKQHWYEGAAFKRGVQDGVSHWQNGVLCLPGECLIDSPGNLPTSSSARFDHRP